MKKPRSLNHYLRLWNMGMISLPLDLLLAPGFIYLFQDGLSLISMRGRYGILALSVLLLTLPLLKERLLSFIVESQGAQLDAKALKNQFRFLVSAGIAIVVLIDLAYRLKDLGIYVSLGFIAVALLALPSWYRSMKRKAEEVEDVVKTFSPEQLSISTQQIDLVFTTLLIGTRVGALLAVLSALLIYNTLLSLCLAFTASVISYWIIRPEADDLVAICRKCGLWSHRSFQFDGYCPGCADLSLKSFQYRKQKSRFTALQNVLDKVDKTLENMTPIKRK